MILRILLSPKCFLTKLQVRCQLGPSALSHWSCVSSFFQLFEELQEGLTQKAEDQSPSQAPGLRRRAGSVAQGEGPRGAAFLPGSIGGPCRTQLSDSSTSELFCLQRVLN